MKVRPDDRHDIFVSFADVDNEPFVGNERGWVTNVLESITRSLTKKVGPVNLIPDLAPLQSRDVSDNRLNLFQKLKAASTFMIILSPGYLASRRCEIERETFLQKIKENQETTENRIFIIEKVRLEDNTIPMSLTKYPRYRFWDYDEKGKARTLAVPQPIQSEVLYHQKIDDISKDLAIAKHESCSKTITSSTVCIQDQGSPPNVYLAEVTEDLIHHRDGVRRYLEQFGFRVLSEKSGSFSSIEKANENLKKVLKQSNFFVQLLSNKVDSAVAEDSANWETVQYGIAKLMGLPILQWCSEDLDIEGIRDPSKRALLQLETVKAMNIEEFKQLVRNRLTTKSSPLQISEQFVFLNTNEADNFLAASLGNVLNNLGLIWRKPLHRGRPTIVRRDLESNLSTCDALIVLYGSTNAKWVENQLKYYHRISRSRPLKVLAVYEGPPEDKPEIQSSIPALKVLNCRHGIDETKIRNFLSPLLEEKSA